MNQEEYFALAKAEAKHWWHQGLKDRLKYYFAAAIQESGEDQLEVLETKKFKNNKKYVKYKTDLRLLKRLLLGPRYAHWNNAEIGSHINFYREPDVFDRNVYQSMCYFHN